MVFQLMGREQTPTAPSSPYPPHLLPPLPPNPPLRTPLRSLLLLRVPSGLLVPSKRRGQEEVHQRSQDVGGFRRQDFGQERRVEGGKLL